MDTLRIFLSKKLGTYILLISAGFYCHNTTIYKDTHTYLKINSNHCMQPYYSDPQE
jgi:hypothetical protein